MRLHLATGIWFCFACSPIASDGTPQGADVIDWVRRTEGVSVSEAIRLLDSGATFTNAWAGHVENYRPTATGTEWELPVLERTRPERVAEALRAAWTHYTASPLHLHGSNYLAGRGIDVSILEEHTGRPGVGHTGPERDGLVRALEARGFTDDELLDAGLASRRMSEKTLIDFYRQRVLIPLRSANGQIAGFIGRNIGDSRYPKYKNPPCTHLYDKSTNLYQPLPGPTAKDGQVVIVEGTLDAMAIAIAAIQAGLNDRFCPVTQSGRELSARQLDYVLALHSMPPVVAFDGDAPGRDSNVRLAIAAAYKHREVVITTLPDGHDPASWLADNGVAGLATWTRKGCLEPGRTGIRPNLAGRVVAAHYLKSVTDARAATTADLGRIRRDLVETGSRLPPHAAGRWTAACAAILGGSEYDVAPTAAIGSARIGREPIVCETMAL
jgi:DNA primase catalytic core